MSTDVPTHIPWHELQDTGRRIICPDMKVPLQVTRKQTPRTWPFTPQIYSHCLHFLSESGRTPQVTVTCTSPSPGTYVHSKTAPTQSHTKGKRSRLASPSIEKDSTLDTLSHPVPHLGYDTPVPSQEQPEIFTASFNLL